MASGCRIGQSRHTACLITPRDNRYDVSRWVYFNIMSLEKHICWVVGPKEIIEVTGLTMSFQCVAPSQPGTVSQSQRIQVKVQKILLIEHQSDFLRIIIRRLTHKHQENRDRVSFCLALAKRTWHLVHASQALVDWIDLYCCQFRYYRTPAIMDPYTSFINVSCMK